jgi:hypothetical protein
MAAQKLSPQELAAAQRRLEVLATCMAPGEHIAGMAMGTEQATGHAGVIAVTDRQIAFIGQPGGETQLFCPLDDIELVGYESLGGAARMSVTAQGRVTTWRDIIPIERAAEISQLIENKGAMAKAVAPPMAAMQAPIGTQVTQAQPPPTAVTSTGGVSVQRYGPAPSEIVLPEARPEPARPASSQDQKPGLMDRAKSFVKDLGNDPGASPSTRSSTTSTRSTSSGLGQRNALRVVAGGSILVGLLATALGGIVLLWIIVAAVGVGMGVTAYQRNRRTIRDSVTEGLAIGGIIVGGLSLLIAITQII